MHSSDEMLQAGIAILVINILLMILGTSLGCYDTGRRAGPKGIGGQYVELIN
jgi:hypothetical protein